MKKIAIVAVALLLGGPCFCQDYIRYGKQFSSVSKEKEKSADVKTGYTWKESNGEVLDIYITKSNACYVLKTSKKSGKEYRKYLSKELSSEIAKELGR